MDAHETAGTKVFGNTLIFREICEWVKLGGKANLVGCMVANKQGFEIAGKSMYRSVKENVQVNLAAAGCSLARLVYYINMVRTVSLQQAAVPSRASIAQLRSRFPGLKRIKLRDPQGDCHCADEKEAGYIRLYDGARCDQPLDEGKDDSQLIGDIGLFWHEHSADMSLLELSLGLIGPNPRFRLVEFEVHSTPPEESSLGRLLTGYHNVGSQKDEVQRIFRDVRHACLPILPIDRFQNLLTLLPAIPLLTCQLGDGETYTDAVHKALACAIKKAALHNQDLYHLGLGIGSSPAILHNYDIHDFLGIKGIDSFEAGFGVQQSVEAFRRAGSYAPSASDIHRAHLGRRAEEKLAQLRVGDDVLSLSPFHAACWLISRHTETLSVHLRANYCNAVKVERWINSVEDICASLTRSAVGTGQIGYRHIQKAEAKAESNEADKAT